MSISFLLGIKEFVLGLVNIIPKLMYFLCVTLTSVLDLLQFVVRKLAGLDIYYVDGVAKDGDIALSFLRSIFMKDSAFPALKNVFWSLVIFGVLILIVAAIIAIIRQEYMPAKDGTTQKNDKTKIIGNFFKSLFLFFIVPASCLFGLMFLDLILVNFDNILKNSAMESNTVLSEVANVDSKLISEPTTNGKQTYTYYDIFWVDSPCSTVTFSGTMFKAAAYNANRVRIDQNYGGVTYSDGLATGQISNFDLFTLTNDEALAELIDTAFASNFKLKSPQTINLGFMKDTSSNGLLWILRDGKTYIDGFSKYNVGLVFYFYDLWQFNFIIAYSCLLISLKVMLNLIFGLMKRSIEIIALFIISPTLVAVMPLDDGKSFKKWRENFMSKALSAIAAITSLNLIFLILPYLQDIQFFNVKFLDLLGATLFTVVALTLTETFIALVSKMIGAEDINESGSALVGKVGKTVMNAAMLVGGTAGLAFKLSPAGAAMKGISAAGKKITSTEKFKNVKRNLLTSKKDKADAGIKAEKDWKQNKTEKETKKVLSQDKEYNQKIDEAYDKYKQHHNAKMSKEEWLKKNDKAQQITKEYTEKNKEKILEERKKSILDEKIASGEGGFLKSKAFTAANKLGLANVRALGSLYFQAIKTNAVRDGKGGFKSMALAFMGKSADYIERENIFAKIKKEQTARTQAAEIEKAKLEKEKQSKNKKK